MTTVSYKNLDIDKLVLSKPVKTNGVYQCNINFSIQSPEINIDLENDKFTFTMVKKGKFVTALEEIEEKIINTLYKNSTDFFNGKTFTENKIREAFKKTFSIDNNGLVTLNAKGSPYLKIYDYFNEVTKAPQGPFTGVCIFQLNPVKFVKKDIIASYSLRFIKLPMEKKKTRECLFDDEPTNEVQEVKKEEVKKEVKKEEALVINGDRCLTTTEEKEEVQQEVNEVTENTDKEWTITDKDEGVKSEPDYTSFFED